MLIAPVFNFGLLGQSNIQSTLNDLREFAVYTVVHSLGSALGGPTVTPSRVFVCSMR